MKIVIEAAVKEYLEKADTNRLVIAMIPDRTNSCCGTGKTRKFYSPDIRPAKPEEYFGDGFQQLRSDGLEVWISQKAFEGLTGDTVTISVKKTFFSQTLSCEGIESIFE